MPIDYSKWDNLELSDDSDIEVHPNIERGTFIRLRQRKIREERENRRIRKERAEALIAMNNDLLERIEKLRDEVSAADEQKMEDISRQWEQDVESSQEFKNKRDEAIKNGDNPEQPSEDEMITALKARISDDLLKAAANIDTLEAKRQEYTKQLEVHIGKLQKSLEDARRELDEVNREIAKHVAPDSITHTGFDRSFVSKSSGTSAPKKAAQSSKAAEKVTVTTDEVLNPGSVGKFDQPEQLADDDIDADALDDEGNLRLDDDAKKFASITNMSDSMDYILKHLDIISEEKSNQILGHAFTHQLAGRDALSRQYVHQGLILTYILEMGSSGVNMFFSRIGAKGSPAQVMFEKDVESRYKHIVERCKVIKSETEQSNGPEVESIQLQTDSPDTQISISVPNTDEDSERMELFKQLPEEFQNALKVGTIDELNKVLATVPGSEAERILEICGKGQFLKIDEEIVVDPNEE
ncbi:hsp90 co-chaperone Cdc37 [Coemansia brasiliensis]|uniref:Hsp90 chaperone protein kinase-targeting subunit n=1 Tax=Coemansia brasiliensis TaxID=2650707 RepID=A0A9W8I5Y6_9FUNG|nr:hsp90 co-chaperone Cdc37 [Coemansia brasiliensis]